MSEYLVKDFQEIILTIENKIGKHCLVLPLDSALLFGLPVGC